MFYVYNPLQLSQPQEVGAVILTLTMQMKQLADMLSSLPKTHTWPASNEV